MLHCNVRALLRCGMVRRKQIFAQPKLNLTTPHQASPHRTVSVGIPLYAA